jgi:pyruvate, orthophosphate dikinase
MTKRLMEKYLYSFNEGGKEMKNLLGGKGANLAEMTKMGLPVPKGFIISTKACIKYYEKDQSYKEDLNNQISEKLKELEESTGKKLGDPENPLLVSVRSGAAISMPGMMDTVLNLGLNEKTIQGLIKKTEDERFVYDSYRRFIQMFGNVVMGIEHDKFEKVIEDVKEKESVENDMEISVEGLKKIISEYKDLVLREEGKEFPEDPRDQLDMAINSVFDSWNNKRAITYRKANGIPDDLGTGVTVQEMVFGNMGNDSGTGVGFTRNPSTGEKEHYGEYLLNAQGEDVVAGIRTPKPLEELKNDLPEVYSRLVEIINLLEEKYRDVQDFEFTIEKGKLYLLQTRTGKRTSPAALKIAVDMVREEIISKEEALERIEPEQLVQLLHRRIDPNADIESVAKGLPASPGAAFGKVVFTADEAEEMGEKGERVILVRPETTPDDIHGMVQAKGTLTSRGGMTSHAAVVARGMGMPCVAGCGEILIDLPNEVFKIKDKTVKKGDIITIDGGNGKVFLGETPMVEPEMNENFKTLLSWADEKRELGVFANADNPEDAKKARELGAEGIGLCRTEHMFMAQERLPVVQAMIMAETKEEREKELRRLLPFQKSDFKGILKEMQDLPVVIRLLDPPLHEFLPSFEETLKKVTSLKIKNEDEQELKKQEKILERIKSLQEINPMLGLRGCRLGILFPEIYEMQTEAIIKASLELKKEGLNVKPKIMIPLVGHVNEFNVLKDKVKKLADEIIKEENIELNYEIGTMIELPRSALTADEIAKSAQFFSFGTNDLTQTTFGISRDDAESKFLLQYIAEGILKENPFQSIDREGLGKLIKMGVDLGRKSNSELEVGICGEHGGDPSSVEFCHQTGFNYVSCSPFRVPIARLSAAQAVLKKE